MKRPITQTPEFTPNHFVAFHQRRLFVHSQKQAPFAVSFKATAMFCLFVFGHRYMGSCEYFTYNGGEFYVNARMYHIQFCPVSADQAVLKFPSVPDRGLTVTQMNGVLMRCFLWAALRSYSLVASIVLLLLGLFLLRTGSHGYLMIGLAIAGFLLSAWAWIYKPKASPERIDGYIRLMTPRSQTQGPVEVAPLQDTSPIKASKSARVIDMVRPGRYHTLQEDVTSNPTPDFK